MAPSSVTNCSDVIAFARESLIRRLEYVNQQLDGRQYLMGDTFTARDAYLFVMLTWAHKLRRELGSDVEAYDERVSKRPRVQEALKAERAHK